LNIRTDLAIESREIFHEKKGDEGEIPGVQVQVDNPCDQISVTRISISDERGSRAMGKPVGNYITIEVRGLGEDDEKLKADAIRVLSKELSRLIHFHYHLKMLLIGLGNKKVTPDALGPLTVEKVMVTRHMFLITDAEGDDHVSCVSVLAPGVMATTGMETAEIIKSAVDITKPEAVLAVDALAARNIERINTTIQISDTGISPGSGTGNMRKDLTEKSLGTKVIAIGVPTVIDSKTLILDNLEGFLTNPTAVEKHIEKKGEPMIVTTSDIDCVIEVFSEIIGEAINKVLHPGIYSQ
jgi:spore protease